MNTGDVAWILLCSALVLLMTPGLALFYGGLARSKNAASTIMYSLMSMGIVGVVWVLWGYTLAFGPDLANLIGDLSYLGLSGVSATQPGPHADNMPHQAFMMFQGMFAIITPALVTGAFAERMKFGSYVLFVVLWVTIVYVPVAHWVWGGGWISDLGALDFAGGNVVHINSGVAALAAALIFGKRLGFRIEPMGHTTSLWLCSELGSSGSDGSGSMRVRPSPRTAARLMHSLSPTRPPLPGYWDGLRHRGCSTVSPRSSEPHRARSPD